jgi:Fe-S-cluster containining protein
MPAEIKIEDLLRLGEITEDDLNLSRKKLASRLKKEGIIQSYRDSTGLFLLTQKANGDCLYLDSKTRRCTVYEKRPQMCRNFPTKAGNRLGHCPMLDLSHR